MGHPSPSSGRLRLLRRGTIAGLFAPAAALAVAAAVAVGIRALVLGGADAALIVMGFDPDRARLIDSLVVAFLGAAVARLASGAAIAAVPGGFTAFAICYAGVYGSETLAAVAAHGTDGRFDPGGWLLTTLTLLVIVGLVSVAASLLGGHLRAFIIMAGRDLRAAVRERRQRLRRLARPAALVVAASLVAVSVPVFGDMVDYTPDVYMRQGAPAQPGLLDVGALPAPDGADRGGDAADARPPQVTGTIEQGVLASSAPWLGWRPSGSGRLVDLQFPAPWKGGTSSSIEVALYTPPGYDADPTRRYPVVYSAPFLPGPLAPLFDGFFTSGTAPPEILVFVREIGGPYPDDECIDSYDGREKIESFIVDTIVPWVDAHYRTIASPDARTVFGFSQGGFCAPMLLFRHPDVFRQSVSLSGYYTAGISSGQTVNAWRPFGGNAAYEASHSPDRLAPALAPAIARRLFVVLTGNPREPFYGPQLTSFDAELTRLAIPHAVIDDPNGHAWIGFEHDCPLALRLIGLRQAALGVFGPVPVTAPDGSSGG